MTRSTLQRRNQQNIGNDSLVADQKRDDFDLGKRVIELLSEVAPPNAIDPASHATPKQPIRSLIAPNYELLGQIVSLCSLSLQHKHLFLADLDWRLSPPLILGQCRLLRRKGRPFAFVSWAFVTKEVAKRLEGLPGRIQPDEWNCGSQLAFIDVVAPFGEADICMQEVSKHLKN